MNLPAAAQKRTILFVWNYLEWGGPQIYYLAIMRQAKPDWDIVAILPKDSSPDIFGFLEQMGVRIELLDLSIDISPAATIAQKMKRQIRRLRSESEVRRVLRKFDLSESILNIETAPWQSWQHLALLSVRGANIFVTLNNLLPPASRWRELIWNARMQFVSRLPGMHVIASNRDTKHKLKRWVSSTFWDDITVAHAAFDPVQIDAARLTREDAREIRVRHDIPLDKAVVLAVGNFVDRKGRWVFLEAAAQLLKTESDLFFVWLTPQLPGDADRAQVESYGINDSLKIIRSESLGKDRMDVLRFFNIADIFALPSYIEGLPISLLEAMAIGVASISTRVFAIPEAIEHMQTGLLIEAGRSDQLADSILMLKNDIELRRRLAAAGKSFVTENFDERESARKCIAAFKECFADGR